MSQEQYTTEKEERKKGKHLDAYERGQIEALKKLSKSNRAIAREIGCSPTTIGKELRNGTAERKGTKGRLPMYKARRGQQQYEENRKRSRRGTKVKNCQAFMAWIVRQQKERDWSFDASVGYSVPCGYRGQSTTVKAYPNHIEIWINGCLVASHKRLYGRKEESLDLKHYLPILAQKGRAMRFARPVQKLVPSTFIDWMEGQQLKAKEMVELLEACLEIGYQAVMQRERTPRTEYAPTEAVPVQMVDLGQYDKLYAREAAR